jgi:cellulose synthase/poly-beta-1,6-N-acetylglucosamine synthase-like glycosyltransferase
VILDPIAVLMFWVPIGILLYHWVVFPVVLVVLAGLSRCRRSPEGRSEQPLVTIVMAAYNEETLIAGKIRNCLELDYPPGMLEILVGSDSSTDATDDIVRLFTDVRVRLVRFEPQSGKVAVQNRLLREARGDVILTTDVDCLLTPSSLRLMVERLRDASVAVVSPSYSRLNIDGSPAEGFYDRWESKVKELEGRLGSMVGCYGYAYIMRREVADPIPDDTILDDFVFAVRPFRKGYNVVVEPGALVVTRTESEGLEFGRKVRISRGNLQALLRFADLLQPKYGVKAWIYFSHKVVRMMVPFLLLAMLIASAVELPRSLFAAMLVLQLAILASVPFLLVAKGKWRKLLFPQYYYLMNIALLVGYWQFFTNRERYWARTPRS